MDKCSVEGCYRNIVNQTHKLCQVHNKQRLEERKLKLVAEGRMELPPERSKKKSTNGRRQKKIAPMSAKRVEENKKYKETREKKRDWQKKNGYYNCVFCNSRLIDTDDEVADCHHMVGRDGDNLAKWANLFFSHRDCHTNYHAWNIEQLMGTSWYLKFVDRLKTFHREGYNQELRRMNKAGVIDDDQYLKMYRPEK